MKSKEYAFLDLNDQQKKVRETSESKGLSEEILLVMEETGMQMSDLNKMANARVLVEELYNQGFRPTIFVPADQYEDLALEITGFGVVIPNESKITKKFFNTRGDNPMVHNTKVENIFEVNRGLVTLGRTPYVSEAGYVVELDVSKEEIVPLLTGDKGAFRGVVHLKTKHVKPEQMRVVKVVAPSGEKEQLMELQNKLMTAKQDLERK